MLQRAAEGGAPSRAAALGQLSQADAMRAAASAPAGRGPGGSLAAMRGAQNGTAVTMGQGAQQAMDGRAAETARDQSVFAGSANTVRGQDIAVASANATLDAQQRQLNQQHEQANERLAWDTRNAQQQAAGEFQRQQDGRANAERAARDAEIAADWEKAKTGASIGLGVLGMVSDERAKQSVVPMGALGALIRRAK